jgi:predicted amidohydrolase YtcJ
MLKMMCSVAVSIAFVVGASAQPAELVVTNANIWTGDETLARATALAVRDGVLVYVGDDSGVGEFVGKLTHVINAEGRFVTPGLIDAHVHLTGAADSLAILDLRDAASKAELLAIVSEAAAGQATDAWIIGRGWSAESWPDQTPPTAAELNDASGGRPVVLTRMDGHSLIASSTALTAAGITSDGPEDPPGGKIGRTADGAPDGALYEGAMGLVRALIPDRDELQTRELIKQAVAHANALGVTQIGAIDPMDSVIRYFAPLDTSGELTLRTSVTISEGASTVNGWMPALEWAAANPHPSERVRVLGFKGYMDGSLGSRTAWMFEPYEDNPRDQNNAGFPLAMVENSELPELIRVGAAMGLQPAVHAIGDHANAALLDWYEELPASVREQVRPRIEHAQHLRPGDIARFGALGVVPSMQPYHKADDGRYADQRIGHERNESSYAYRGLLDTRAVLAFGSDWPVVSVDPLLGIHAAVTGRTLDGKVWVPEQSITAEEALRAYTSGAAWCLHSENLTGRLKVAMAADFVMFDRDLLTIDPEEIPDAVVLLTVIGGEIVFERD